MTFYKKPCSAAEILGWMALVKVYHKQIII
jgi:hypothetical protein